MRFQILLIQEKSVNMAGTEPCKCYLFLHGSHVYMASDSISEKILASVLKYKVSKIKDQNPSNTIYDIHNS